MKKIEILAPAGSMESLYAAINKGADAIYLGGNKFSARAYASNFDNENILKAIDYAHSYGVKVYVALNTILKESEIKEAIKYAGYLYEIGVDALIIQDLGLFKNLKKLYPKMELHASTQMTIHNGEAAQYFTEKGFSRIVLSREMTIDEIKHISTNLDIETEIFIHGAICISYSGQCLMSSVIGGRSGNRGRCAQPCRMEYTLESDGKGSKKAYLLSPKDMCTIDDIKEIVDSGTKSLKIEGRMKRPEYVAGVVENYRKAIDKILLNNKYDLEKGKIELKQLFNRSGFTNAFLKKDTGRDMMSYNSPKNSGVPLGKVKDDNSIVLLNKIMLGDGVRYGDKGFTVSKILNKGKEVTEGNMGDVVTLFPIEYKKGESIFKSLDKELFENLKSSINAYEKKKYVSAKVIFKVGEPMKIIITLDGKEYEHIGANVEVAQNKPLQKERVIESLKKVTSESPYIISNINFEEFTEGFVRVSDINALRRDALEVVRKSICKSYRRVRPQNTDIADNKINKSFEINKNIYSCITSEQLKALEEMNAEVVAIDIFSREKGALKKSDIIELFNRRNKIDIYLKISSIVKGEFSVVCKVIEELKPYISGIITSNIGLINKYNKDMNIIGDYKLNIMNSESLSFYEEEVSVPTLSIEMNRSEIKAIKNSKLQNSAVLVYGKPELMISEYCPIGSTFGGKTSTTKCNMACMYNKFSLIDRVNEKSRVMTDVFCRSYILNHKPINLIEQISELESMGIRYFRYDFRDESYEEVKDILVNKVFDNSMFTKGHYRRGVE